MKDDSKIWVIVLAAGEGSRLHSLTADAKGDPVPKQFCAFVPDAPAPARRDGSRGRPGCRRPRTMLESTLDRAARIAPPERTVAIVAASHRRWWERGLTGLPPENVIVQPANRGTAAGILLPLLHVLLRDASASVLILPSDHYVRDEAVMDGAVREALAFSKGHSGRLTLLGITPLSPDEGYGWIVPSGAGKQEDKAVGTFVEKPPRSIAAMLMRAGALWNSFMMAGALRTFLDHFERALPDLLDRFTAVIEEGLDARRLEGLYENLPVFDFSRHLLEKTVDSLAMHAVPECGWSDLGTPERIREVGGHVLRPEGMHGSNEPPQYEFGTPYAGQPDLSGM